MDIITLTYDTVVLQYLNGFR